MSMSLIFPYLEFIRYYLRSGNAHDLHSPYVYDLYTRAIRPHRSKGLFKLNYSSERENEGKVYHHEGREIMWGEVLQKRLLASEESIEVIDLGGGSKHTPGVSREIKKIARWSGRRPGAGRLLYRLTSYIQPDWILELGTSLGIGTLYLHQASPNTPLTTIEGSSSVAEVAKKNLKEFKRIDVINSSFDRFFEERWSAPEGSGLIMVDGDHQYQSVKRYFDYLTKEVNADTVILFDDIHWSEGMQRAWREICMDEKARVTIDLYTFGIVFFKKELSRQHFILWNKDCF